MKLCCSGEILSDSYVEEQKKRGEEGNEKINGDELALSYFLRLHSPFSVNFISL